MLPNKEIKKEKKGSKKISVKIIFFAKSKEITGKKYLNLKLPPNSNINNLINLLKELYPTLNDLNFSIAINNEYIYNYDVELKDKDIVSIIPPVSGG
jgi:MoaD family protein